MMMTKEMQLKKNRRKNEKRLDKDELLDYKTDINFFARDICQLCRTAYGIEHHHPVFGCRGADKDDRVLVLVCRSCHEKCHKEKHGEWNTKAKKIGENNWEKHNA